LGTKVASCSPAIGASVIAGGRNRATTVGTSAWRQASDELHGIAEVRSAPEVAVTLTGGAPTLPLPTLSADSAEPSGAVEDAVPPTSVGPVRVQPEGGVAEEVQAEGGDAEGVGVQLVEPEWLEANGGDAPSKHVTETQQCQVRMDRKQAREAKEQRRQARRARREARAALEAPASGDAASESMEHSSTALGAMAAAGPTASDAQPAAPRMDVGVSYIPLQAIGLPSADVAAASDGEPVTLQVSSAGKRQRLLDGAPITVKSADTAMGSLRVQSLAKASTAARDGGGHCTIATPATNWAITSQNAAAVAGSCASAAMSAVVQEGGAEFIGGVAESAGDSAGSIPAPPMPDPVAFVNALMARALLAGGRGLREERFGEVPGLSDFPRMGNEGVLAALRQADMSEAQWAAALHTVHAGGCISVADLAAAAGGRLRFMKHEEREGGGASGGGGAAGEPSMNQKHAATAKVVTPAGGATPVSEAAAAAPPGPRVAFVRAVNLVQLLPALGVEGVRVWLFTSCGAAISPIHICLLASRIAWLARAGGSEAAARHSAASADAAATGTAALNTAERPETEAVLLPCPADDLGRALAGKHATKRKRSEREREAALAAGASAEAGAGAGEAWRTGGNGSDASADAGGDSIDRRGCGDIRCSPESGGDAAAGTAAVPSAAKRARTDGAASYSWPAPVATCLHSDAGPRAESGRSGMEIDGLSQLAGDGRGVGELHPATSQEAARAGDGGIDASAAVDGRDAEPVAEHDTEQDAEQDASSSAALPLAVPLGLSSDASGCSASIEAAAPQPCVPAAAAGRLSGAAAQPAAAEPRGDAVSKPVAASPVRVLDAGTNNAPASDAAASGTVTSDASTSAPDWVFSEQAPQVAESRRSMYRHVYMPGPGRRPPVADPQRVNKQEQLFAAAREAMEEEQRQRSAARTAALAAARGAPTARSGAGRSVGSGGTACRSAGVLPSSAQLASSDPYVVLGLSRDSEPGAIRTRFKELARLLHPDKLPRTLERHGLWTSSAEAPADDSTSGLPGSAPAAGFRSASAATAAGSVPRLPGAAGGADGSWCSLGVASAPPALSSLSDGGAVGSLLAGGSGGDAFVLVQRAYQTLMAGWQ
jgi:hypothetical protein